MPKQSGHLDIAALPAELRRLQREAAALRRLASRTEECADSLELRLQEFEKSFAPKFLDPKNAGYTAKPHHRAPTDSAFLSVLAANIGVEKLEIERLPDGAASVCIDGGKVFRLAPTLAALLETLALDTHAADDRLVGWKSRDEVRRKLEKQMGRRISRHALDGLLSRLRAALTAAEVNPFLIQTNRKSGLRFALRRARSREGL